MRKNDAQIGKPSILYKDAKSNIEALSGIESGATAYATGTKELGCYDGTQWVWVSPSDIDNFDVQGGTGTLIFPASGAYTLTIPTTGIVALGTGTAGYIPKWGDSNTLINSTLIKTGTNIFILDTGDIAALTWTIPANATGYLKNNGSGSLSWDTVSGGGPIGGSGTANYIPKWSDANTLTDSIIYKDTFSLLPRINIPGILRVNLGHTVAFVVEQSDVKNNVLAVDTINGLVGINKSPQLAALDIVGSIKATGAVDVDGNIFAQGNIKTKTSNKAGIVLTGAGKTGNYVITIQPKDNLTNNHVFELPDADTGLRELLTANRTYYVRTDGDDSHTGLVNYAAGAFLTIQKAVDTIANTLDIAGKTVTIQVGDGTYTGTVTLKNVVGYASPGNLVIQGNSGTPTNVIISPASGSAIYGSGISTVWDIKYLKVTAPTGINLANNITVRITGVDFGACTSYHTNINNGCQLLVIGNYTISGNSPYHYWTAGGGYIECINKTITITSNITVTNFVRAARYGYLNHYGCTFSLGAYSVTGGRYYGTQLSLIFTNNGGANYFPGNTSGTVDPTSVYA